MLAPHSLQIRREHPKPIWIVFHVSESFVAPLTEDTAHCPRARCLSMIMVRGPMTVFITGGTAAAGGASPPLFKEYFLPPLDSYTIIPFEI